MTETTETSPLNEAVEINQTSISDLFEKKASEVTDEEIKLAVDFLRERREVWEVEEVAKRKGGRRAKVSQGTAESKQGKVKLDMDQLDIDLD